MTSSPIPSSNPSNSPFPSGTGRYAPSPSGDLHLGNLRTAILAWAMARRGAKPFYLRVEDLDRVRPGAAERQIADLERWVWIGMRAPAPRQSVLRIAKAPRARKRAYCIRARALPPMRRRFNSCARRDSCTSATAPAAKFRRRRVPRTVPRAHTRVPAVS